MCVFEEGGGPSVLLQFESIIEPTAISRNTTICWSKQVSLYAFRACFGSSLSCLKINKIYFHQITEPFNVS